MFADTVAHNLYCQIRADDNSSTCTCTFMTGACVNEIKLTRLITRFYNKAKKGCHVRISDISLVMLWVRISIRERCTTLCDQVW